MWDLYGVVIFILFSAFFTVPSSECLSENENFSANVDFSYPTRHEA